MSSPSIRARSTRPGLFSIVTFELLANGEVIETVTFGSGLISFTWSGLPVVDSDGVPIEYSVNEVAIDGFDSALPDPVALDPEGYSDQREILTVTNTFTPGPAVASIDGLKLLEGRDLTDGEFTFDARPHTEATHGLHLVERNP